MNSLRSSRIVTLSGSSGLVKLGQPVPESYLSSELNSGSPVVNNGTIIYDSTSDFTMGGFNVQISGTGNLIKRGSGLLKIIGNNSYTGWTLIEPGARLQVSEDNQGQFTSSVVTNTTRAPTSVCSERAVVSVARLRGQTSGQFVYPKKRKVSWPAVSVAKS